MVKLRRSHRAGHKEKYVFFLCSSANVISYIFKVPVFQTLKFKFMESFKKAMSQNESARTLLSFLKLSLYGLYLHLTGSVIIRDDLDPRESIDLFSQARSFNCVKQPLRRKQRKIVLTITINIKKCAVLC